MSTCLPKAETAKLNELRVELMYEQFAPDGMRGDEMREIKKKCENNPKQEEANFKTALRILEAEGDEEVARFLLDNGLADMKGCVYLDSRDEQVRVSCHTRSL